VSCNDFPKRANQVLQIHIFSQFSKGKALPVLPGFQLGTANNSSTSWLISNPAGNLSASATGIPSLQVSREWLVRELTSYETDIPLGDFDAQTLLVMQLKSSQAPQLWLHPPVPPPWPGWAGRLHSPFLPQSPPPTS